MKHRTFAVVALAAVGVFCGALSAAAAPTTEIVQGQYLRLVSVADWDAAMGMLPGETVQWDVEVSADAPEPGTMTIGISAVGGAPLVVDASLCTQAWTPSGCAGGATVLQTAWAMPRDGVEVELFEIADTDVAHLRLAVALAPGSEMGATDIRVHAHGTGGDSVIVGPGGGLATTGMSPIVPWIFGGGAVLLLLGVVLIVLRRRRPSDDEGDES